MAKGPEIVCGDVPSVAVTWQVLLNVPREANLLSKCFEESKTAFGAFQKASPKLGNPAFSDVVCTIVEDRVDSGEQHRPKSKRRRKL